MSADIQQGQGRVLRDWVETSLNSYLGMGQAQLRKRDLNGARNSFDLARLVDPNDPEARVGLIQVDLLAGNYNKAIQMIRELGRRAPQVFATTFDVTVWHETQEAYDEFLRVFRQQTATGGSDNEMLSALTGYTAWTTNDRRAALNQFRQAARLVLQEPAWVNIVRALESPVSTRPSPLATRAASRK